MEKKSLEEDVHKYYERRANEIIARNLERIQQIKKESEEKAESLKKCREEFDSIKDVWEAARYAGDNEPNKAVKKKGQPYIPHRHSERQGILLSLYPESGSHIRKMNASQSKWALFNILNYKQKIEEEIHKYSNH